MPLDKGGSNERDNGGIFTRFHDRFCDGCVGCDNHIIRMGIMTARTRLILYLAAFLVGLVGVLEFRETVKEWSQKDYAELLLDTAFAEIGE